MISVAAAVIFKDGLVLVTQRKPESHLAGLWEFPGGKIEAGETPERAAIRELKEEVGIDIHVNELLDTTIYTYNQGTHTKTIQLMFYLAQTTESSPAPQAIECADVRWVDGKELKKLSFPPADQSVLEKIHELLA